ncbi:hypothetical protein C5O80_05710 [Burkholderia sp. SRS-46]|nr:hypothetical protein C5O80_05710 [Burkholderia sp. SRS-46]
MQARDIVLRHAAAAAASSAIPVPLLDLAAGVSIQIRMARQLCALYGVRFTPHVVRQVVTGIVENVPANDLSGPVLRYVSFAGYFTGPLVSGGLTAAYTYVLGEVLIERLASHQRIDVPAPSERTPPHPSGQT